ncbi:hypothetical protein [Lactiplantibacillus songbeiensis]|uniref:Uncharacterized protein n=1 Tax=Lactiplantibacillus songbeiensis TaxID=2559920 RepID=A0ABW4BZ05_9LACO|nr:hypothetical protein [Lactiplantibacillus songbeiensis]
MSRLQRRYIYANLEKIDNLVFAYGIDQSDFVHGIKRLPSNLVSLVGVDDDVHAVNAHTGLNVINDENDIRRFLLQSHTEQVKWMDYDEVGDLDFLTATEIAELLYLGHMNRPIRSPFNYKLRNHYVFLEQRNGGIKLYCYYLSAFSHVLNASILRHTLAAYRGRRMFMRTISVPRVPEPIIKQLMHLMSDGLFIYFDQSMVRQRQLLVPVHTEIANDDIEVFDPARNDDGQHTHNVATLTFNLVSSQWGLTIHDAKAFEDHL